MSVFEGAFFWWPSFQMNLLHMTPTGMSSKTGFYFSRVELLPNKYDGNSLKILPSPFTSSLYDYIVSSQYYVNLNNHLFWFSVLTIFLSIISYFKFLHYCSLFIDRITSYSLNSFFPPKLLTINLASVSVSPFPGGHFILSRLVFSCFSIF